VGPPELARCVSYRDIIPLLIQNKFGIQALVVGALSSGGPALCASVLIKGGVLLKISQVWPWFKAIEYADRIVTMPNYSTGNQEKVSPKIIDPP